MDHGHALLLRALRERRPDWLTRPGISMLEVGSTREPLSSQDSTRILSAFCHEQGWSFTTCDVDPINSGHARELFRSMGAPFDAVTASPLDP